MRNLLIDQERRKQKYEEVALHGFETLADDADNGAEIDRELYSAINQLPYKQKYVVLERLDKKKFKEISSEMGLSINTVLGIFRYAVNNLRKYMEDEK